MNTVLPTQIVILGGGGDLAKRKLIPSLLDLYVRNKLPQTFSITGLARTYRTDEEYRQFVAEAIQTHQHNHTSENILKFCEHINYVSGSFDDAETYANLQNVLNSFSGTQNICTNRLFYLAVPPEYYQIIFENLHESKLTKPCDDTQGWARVLVEKPFGNDLKTAQALDKTLGALFKEDQIFRIDHYLAKEAVQNLLSFRFANSLLQSSWSKKTVEKVLITMHETVDVQHRGSFYDHIGALRDVGQNHLLQLLALVAMDEPKTFTAKDIRKERSKVLKKLIPIDAKNISNSVSRGQYQSYTQAPGVSENSQTETYFSFTAYLNTSTWRGVPFHVEAGKAMSSNVVSIDVIFKDIKSGPFKEASGKNTLTKNKITLTISPEQSMSVTLSAKRPGHGYDLEPRTLLFTCAKDTQEISAYEKVLLDCISGDQTLFTQTNEVLASWKFITSILNNWHTVPLDTYEAGKGMSPKHLTK